ncbi:MAG TPA: response regulator transcription factor [Candidatus Ventricola intestinavium]|nr:response regulator transcription factor [Candidatus Ventricola intestinavium]
MLKVIIADDEARVCSLIQMLIDWQELNMELAGTASNGLQALELIQTCSPDILITDIRMPGCHGLELIERAKRLKPALEIVIISGYAHFEYAQSAIRHGVGDYLLKPIDRQELMETMRKLGERCRSRRCLGSEVENLRRSSREDKRQLQERLVQDLLCRRLEDPTPERLWEEYRFQAQPGLLQVALLSMDYDAERFSPASLAVIEEKAETVFRTELEPLCSQVLCHMEKQGGGVLLCYLPEQQKAVKKRLRDCLNQLDAQRGLFGQVSFSLAVSPPVTQVERLAQACDRARMTAMERLTEGTGRLLESLPPPSAVDRERALAACLRLAQERPEQLSRQDADTAVSALEAEVLRTPHVRGSEILHLVTEAARVFLQRPDVQDRERQLEAFEGRCRCMGEARQLYDALRTLLAGQIDQISERHRSGSTRPIRVARQYVQEHYHEPITLEQVCEEAGFSASYFSALFKKETGEGFIKYLTRVRMEHAKELLQQTSLPVTEVCARVGYSDIKHFTQTFKRETNLSPAQYRKLYG